MISNSRASRIEYCPACGAYIPERYNRCLSCGKNLYPSDERKKENPPSPDKTSAKSKQEYQKTVGNLLYSPFDSDIMHLSSLMDAILQTTDDEWSMIEREKKSKWMKKDNNEVVLPAPRVEGHGLESLIDLRPLFSHKTNVILPGSLKELKDARAEVMEHQYLPFTGGRQSDGRFTRDPGLVEVTIRIVGKP